MADNYDKIKEILGADGGLKVPDGFFESAFGKIQSELPPYPEAPRRNMADDDSVPSCILFIITVIS